MVALVVAVVAVAAATAVHATTCGALYAQCGGTGFTGSLCCASGAGCTRINDYYSQCLPVSSSSSSSSKAATAIAAASASSKTSVKTSTSTKTAAISATSFSASTNPATTGTTTVLATAPSIRGSYWAAASDAGGCSLPVANYANTHYAFALGDQAALGTLAFAPKFCGQMFQINCGHSSVLAVVASTCDIGAHDCGADMIAPLWNAATANAPPGLVNCSLSLTTSNPISSSTEPICFYRPSSEFSNAYYKLLGVLNTSGKLVSGATLAGITGTVSSGDWYQFQAGSAPFASTNTVIFTYSDGSSSTFALSQCVQPSGTQIFS